jgi:membrane-bound metal-dependent hydrolase YbcI (DUF457 family)
MQQQSADARTELLRLWKLATLAIGIGPLVVGSFFGTISHLVLDSLMHHVIHPLMPFSNSNPPAHLARSKSRVRNFESGDVMTHSLMLAKRNATRYNIL